MEAVSFLRLGPGNFYCSLLVKPSQSPDSRTRDGGDRSCLFFFFFSSSIVDLQCCVSFRYIAN